MAYYVYVILCKDNTLYTGIATDPIRRFEEHRAGKGARYTRSRGAAKLVYAEPCDTRSGALRREAALKRFSRKEKLALVGLRGSRKISTIGRHVQRRGHHQVQ